LFAFNLHRRVYHESKDFMKEVSVTTPSSPALAATLRALRGETDVHVVAPALDNLWFTRMLALAPGVDPIIGALGALAGEVPNVLPPPCATPPSSPPPSRP